MTNAVKPLQLSGHAQGGLRGDASGNITLGPPPSPEALPKDERRSQLWDLVPDEWKAWFLEHTPELAWLEKALDALQGLGLSRQRLIPTKVNHPPLPASPSASAPSFPVPLQ